MKMKVHLRLKWQFIIPIILIIAVLLYAYAIPNIATGREIDTSEITDLSSNFNEDTKKPLKCSWTNWYPYSYLQDSLQPSSLTGLDIQFIKVLAKTLHQPIQFDKLSWDETLKALKNGYLDIAFGATYSPERADYVYYSKPYRYEEDALFVLRRNSHLYSFKNTKEFIDYIKQNNFRLGIKKGIISSDKKLNEFIGDPRNSAYINYVATDKDNIELLLLNEIEGFVTDRIEGSSLLLHLNLGKHIIEKNLNMKSPIFLIFSKKTQSLEIVEKFNKAIENLLASHFYTNTLSWYLYPVILLQSVETFWFHLIDLLGMVFFSISGVLIANKLNSSLLSGFIYALLPSIGGGILRDILFSHRPVDALSTPIYLLTISCVVLLGFILSKIYYYAKSKYLFDSHSSFNKQLFKHFKVILAICDALGLAAFTVTGVLISLRARVEPLWLWGPFFAFLTGAAGTILRDILLKRKQLEDIRGPLYSEIAIIWGLFLSICLLINIRNIQPEAIQLYVSITIVGAFLTRMILYFTKLNNVYFKM